MPVKKQIGERTTKMKGFISKAKKTLGAKGLYITLGASLIALAGAGTAAYNKAIDDISNSVVVQEPRSIRQADNKTDSVPKDTDSAEGSSKADNSSKKAEESSSKPDLDVKTQPNVMPVNGEILAAFSNSQLVKDPTLGVWKTHDGVDIKADTGTPVKAMNKGVVLEVKEDPLWGNCIIIDHGSGVMGHYYSLSKKMNVSEGDTVDAGDVIGSVGDTAQCEASMLSHLHFGLKRNGEWIDPLEFIGISRSK